MAYVDQYFRLDIKEFKKHKKGKFIFTESELKGSILVIHDNHISINNDDICITTQKTNYGEKAFFICPECRARVEYLYYINGNCKCRECGHLKYRSTITYRNGMDYCDLKIDKILDKLKVKHDIAYYTGDLIPYIKPKGMRWDTYSQLITQLRYWQCERADRWLRLVRKTYKK